MRKGGTMTDISEKVRAVQAASRGEEVRDAIVAIFRALEADVGEIDKKAITRDDLAEGIKGKQDALTFDSTPTEGSQNPVTSQGIKKAIEEAKPNIVFDETPTEGSQNPVTSSGIRKAIESYNPMVFLKFDYDTSTDTLTETNTYDMVTDLFLMIKERVEKHTRLDVLYKEVDPPLKNEMNVKLDLSDYSAERFTFAANPYDGVLLQVVVYKGGRMERMAKNIGQEET